MRGNSETLAVVVHFGRRSETISCLRTLAKSEVDVCVIDNDPDNRLEPQEVTTHGASLIVTDSISFAAANNEGVQRGRLDSHKFFLILNNDLEISPKNLESLRACLLQTKAGAVAPVIFFKDKPHKVWAAGGKINKVSLSIGGINYIQSAAPYPVSYLPGAAIMVSANAWDAAKGFPERYFLAYEEAEFAIKLRGFGYRLVVCPDSNAYHSVGMSSDTQPKYLYNKFRNRMLFGQFLAGTPGVFWAVVINLSRALGRAPRWSVFVAATKDGLAKKPLNAKTLDAIRRRFGQSEIGDVKER